MLADGSTLAQRIDAIVAELAEFEPRDRLSLLLEYSERLPPLDDRYRAEFEAGGHRVTECQTPVALWVELDANRCVTLDAWVAPKRPPSRVSSA